MDDFGVYTYKGVYMPVCRKCQTKFPNHVWVDGKQRNIKNRHYCLECNPFGQKLRSGPFPKDDLGKVKGRRVERKCKECGRIFHTKNASGVCSTCKSRKQRNTKRDIIIKECGGKCQVCGYDKCRDALCFHHVDPTKKSFNLSTSWHAKLSKLREEASKCLLLCANCHFEIHHRPCGGS